MGIPACAGVLVLSLRAVGVVLWVGCVWDGVGVAGGCCGFVVCRRVGGGFLGFSGCCGLLGIDLVLFRLFGCCSGIGGWCFMVFWICGFDGLVCVLLGWVFVVVGCWFWSVCLGVGGLSVAVCGISACRVVSWDFLVDVGLV